MRTFLDLMQFALLLLLVVFTWGILQESQHFDEKAEMYKCCAANWSRSVK